MSFDFTTIIVAALTAGGTVGVGRAARRSPRQEKRDDFALITTDLRKDLTELKAEVAGQRQQLKETEAVTRWMARWFRACVAVMRESHLDIPPRPQPEPPTASEYLHDIGV